MATVNQITKTGWKTTEFWAAIVAAVLPIVNEAFSLNLPIEAIISAVSALSAYVLGRSGVKAAEVRRLKPQ